MASQSHPGSSSPLARLPLVRTLAENWWLLLLRGVASIAFGVLAFVWPGLTLVALIFLWGAYAVVDGGIALWAAISGKGGEITPRWWLAIVGIVGLLAGLVAFASPGLTALVLRYPKPNVSGIHSWTVEEVGRSKAAIRSGARRASRSRCCS